MPEVQMRTEDNPSAADRAPPITVALVDDEQLTRVALAQALSSSGLELVGEATTGDDAIELVVDVRPDVVLMDLQLPGMSGVQAIEQLGLLAPTSRVLVLTRGEHNRVVEAIIAGAHGYILKSAPVEAIVSALTDRELEIFKRLASGKSNHEIARDLSLSPNTVANHVAGILSKIHVENRIQAAVEAVRSGISR